MFPTQKFDFPNRYKTVIKNRFCHVICSHLDTFQDQFIAVMKYAQLVIGPAGCGKVCSNLTTEGLILQSTYCRVIQQHHQASGRLCQVINLDPAAEEFAYECSVGKDHNDNNS